MGRVIDEPAGKSLRNLDTKAEIESTLGELQTAMTESLDWHAWVRRHPFPALALSALVGYRLGRGRWL